VDGATLSILFRDESTGTPQSPAATPQQGTSQSSITDQQIQAITAAGGIASQVTKAGGWSSPSAVSPSVVSTPPPTAAPVGELPAITTAAQPLTGEAALTRTVQQLSQSDPRATAEELAKLLGGGVTAAQVRSMMAGSPVPVASSPPPVAPVATPPVKSTVDSLVEDTKKLWGQDLVASTKDMWEQEAIDKQRQVDAETAKRRTPPPSPMAEPPRQRETDDTDAVIRATKAHDERTAAGVQASLGQITALASQFGRLPGAIAGAVTASTAIPGVASSMAGAFPALASAAPFIGATTAAAAVPAAVIAGIQGAALTAQQQIQGLSPQTALAQAQAEVRQLLANVRTSERLGAEVAANVTARSQIGASAQGIRDQILKGPLQDLNANLSLFGKFMANLNSGLESLPEGTKNEFFTGVVRAALGPIGAALATGRGINDLLGGDSDVPDKMYGTAAGMWGDLLPPELPAPFGRTDPPRPARPRGRGGL
jgi:hypothetical protein